MSQRTLNMLKKLSYQGLKNLDHETLQKYKRRLNIVDQEGNPFTDKDLIRMIRKYISGKKYSTDRKNIKRKTKKSRGGAKKRTIKKSKKKTDGNSLYFEFDRLFGKGKFWRITKNGTKITTYYGKIGTLGQMTTKDYGSKVDKKFDSLVKSKKKKGYVEKVYYGHVSESDPKPPTKVEREYLRICKKAEQNKKINPMMRNFGCEDLLDQGESELKWFTEWHKDALKKGEYDWDKYNEHEKSKRIKKRSKKRSKKK